MEVKIENVETVIEQESIKTKAGSTGYIYIPKKYAGRKVKVCILKE